MEKQNSTTTTSTTPTSPTKTLFCIAYEEFRNKQWIPGLEYMHAKDETEARLHFGGTFVGKSAWRKFRGRVFRVIAIAPVFGFFAKKENQLFV
jgi:hypothetical protein